MARFIEHHFSSLSRLISCEASYALRRESFDGVYQRRGSAVHKAVEAYVKGVRAQGRGSDPASMEPLITKYVLGALPPEEMDYAVGLLRDFASGFDVSVPEGFEAHSERELACLLYPDDDGAILAEHVPHERLQRWRQDGVTDSDPWPPEAVLVVSTLDDVTWDSARTVCRVQDWKSNRAIKPASEIKYALQTRFYAVQAFALTGIEHIITNVVYLNGLREVEVEMGPEEVASAALEVYQLCHRGEAIDRQLDGLAWSATPGPACATCDVIQSCPAADSVRALFTAEGAAASLSPERWVVASALVEHGEKALRARADTGPVRLENGGWIGFKKKVRSRLRKDWASLLRAQEGVGDAGLVEMGSSQASITRWLRAQPGFAGRANQIVKGLVEDEPYTEFGVWGLGE